MRALALIGALLVIVPAVAGSAGAGGSVSNIAPTVALSYDPGAREGAMGVVSAVMKDRNRESDIVAVRVGPRSGSALERTIGQADLSAQTEPGYAGGWKVWNPNPGKGTLALRHAFALPAASGTYDVEVIDQSGAKGTASFQVTVATTTTSTPPPPTTSTTSTTTTSSSTSSSTSSTTESTTSASITVEPLAEVLSPEDAAMFAAHRNDLSWTLDAVRLQNGDVVLSWHLPPSNVVGVQVWRSMSPYKLLTEMEGRPAAYVDTTLPTDADHARYKITMYTSKTMDGGWIDDAALVELIPGWDESLSANVTMPETRAATASAPPPWAAGALLFSGAALLLTTAGVLWWRRKAR